MAKLMSEQLKDRFAYDLGVQETVRREGWGGVPARECGSLVRLAIEFAEQQMTTGYTGQGFATQAFNSPAYTNRTR